MPLLRPFLRREERILRQAGVREGAWQDNLPECLHLGLVPVETAPLRRAVLPALLEQAFRQKRLSDKNASVRLTADGTSLPVYWAAQAAGAAGTVSAPGYGIWPGGLEQWLLQRYGLACGGAEPELEVTLRAGMGPIGPAAGRKLHAPGDRLHIAACLARRDSRRRRGGAAAGGSVSAGSAAPNGAGGGKNSFRCLTPGRKLTIMQYDLL